MARSSRSPGPVSARPTPLARRRPDLPSWLEQSLARAVAVDRRERPADVLELVLELESGMSTGAPLMRTNRSLYARDPLRFWKGAAAVLFVALLLSLAWR